MHLLVQADGAVEVKTVRSAMFTWRHRQRSSRKTHASTVGQEGEEALGLAEGFLSCTIKFKNSTLASCGLISYGSNSSSFSVFAHSWFSQDGARTRQQENIMSYGARCVAHFSAITNDRRLMMMFACAMSKRGGWLLLVSPTLCNPRTHRCGTYFGYFDFANFVTVTDLSSSTGQDVSHDGPNPGHFFFMNGWTSRRYGTLAPQREEEPTSNGQKSNVAVNAQVARATYSCAACWDTSDWILPKPEGSMGHATPTSVRLRLSFAFLVRMRFLFRGFASKRDREVTTCTRGLPK